LFLYLDPKIVDFFVMQVVAEMFHPYWLLNLFCTRLLSNKSGTPLLRPPIKIKKCGLEKDVVSHEGFIKICF
jgi:hypothetical protein